MKEIKWLERFAEAEANKAMKKTASVKKVAKQIIVNVDCFPSVKVGSFVDYKDAQYKVVDDKFEDEKGAGIVLERVADGEDGGDMEGSADEGSGMGDSAMCHKADGEDGGDMEGSADEGSGMGDSAMCHKADGEDEGGADEGEGAEKVAKAEAGEEYPTVELVETEKPAPSEELSNAEHTKSVTDAPYHPTANPGNAFAIDCPDTFQEAADATAKAIADEDAQDRTSVEGHYTWNKNRILSAVLEDVEKEEKEEAPVEEVVEEAPEFEEEVFELEPEETEKEEKKAE